MEFIELKDKILQAMESAYNLLSGNNTKSNLSTDDHTESEFSDKQLIQSPSKAKEPKDVTELDYSYESRTKLPSKIKKYKNLKKLDISNNKLTELSSEIMELEHIKTLNLSNNKLTQFPFEIILLENLKTLNLSNNKLTQLPPEIRELTNLKTLNLSNNQLTQLPPEIMELTNLTKLSLSGNPLISPPPEIASRGVEAIFTYMKQSKTTENNEAKLILVGNGEVGKTCLAHRLVRNEFLRDTKITKGINISKWTIPAPDSENSEIKLNIWDFGGQEIYHATHQFFLTKRSVYLLVWNARKAKDYDNIYYWLRTIEAFAEDSPIILVMSKLNEINDDLDLKDLKKKFPKIVDYIKVDSYDGKGIDLLKETICKSAWDLPLMRTKWVDSWLKVRLKLESLRENWITYEKFYEICKSEDLDDKSIGVLDDYLNDLGVTLHFKDRVALKNIVILKPEWATEAVYKILSTKSVLDNEGVLQKSELNQILDKETYPPDIYSQLMELMNKFELAYEIPDKQSYLVPELLPKCAPNVFEWDENDDLCFYYCYDSFLPPGVIPRVIVRMHEDIEKKENGMPLCWRGGVTLEIQKSRSLVEMKPDERYIEIRIKGDNKKEALAVICYHLDHINASTKRIKVSKKIPCNCSENCPQRYPYETLLELEKANKEIVQCYESFREVSISTLLDGYKKRGEMLRENEFDVFICHSSKDKPIIENLIKDLKEEGITYWFDSEQIIYGHSVTEQIEDGLQKSKSIIACLSKNLITSDWAKAEYGSILNSELSGNSERTIIPLELDNCEDSDIPLLLRDIKRVTYSNKGEFDRFIKDLKKKNI